MDILGEEVIPVLRKEFAALKPAHVPDAPTHKSLVEAAGGPKDQEVTEPQVDRWTGTRAEDDNELKEV